MNRKVFLTLIQFLLFSTLIFAGFTPEDRSLYKKAMKNVEAIEPYSHFLKNEKSSIKNPDDGYYQLRWEYIRDVFYDNPKVASPKKALDRFIKSCQEKGYLSGDTKDFVRSANILGFELITDAPPKFEVDDSSFKTFNDVAYVTNDGYSQKLDLYVPHNAKKNPVPCIVFIHGGGWAVHKRAWFQAHARYIASKGYAAATIDYRMLNAVTPVECINDAKAAIRWVRANAKRYGIDPNRIGGCGDSAGGQLTALLATSGGIADLEGNGGNPKVSSRIQAAVGFATPALTGNRKSWPWLTGDKPQWFDRVSPYRYISAEDPPMLFLHGEKDELVSPQDPQDMYEKFKSFGIYTEIEFIKDKGHVFYMSKEYAEKALVFFQKIFK